MARGIRKNYSPHGGKPKHNWRNEGGDRKRMLDMKREKTFGFRLRDLMNEYELGENKNTISATIYTKASMRSIDDALEYIERLGEDETISEKMGEDLTILLKRFSRWR